MEVAHDMEVERAVHPPERRWLCKGAHFHAYRTQFPDCLQLSFIDATSSSWESRASVFCFIYI